ncbi:hypothetical protein ScPMuIL_008928 [Solemya velum]
MADKGDLGSTLPLSRVKTIMKSSPDVSSISQEALFMTGRATELFVQNLARVSLEQGGNKNSLEYKDLAEVVNSVELLQFLQDIIPKKIKAMEYLKMMQKMQDEDS